MDPHQHHPPTPTRPLRHVALHPLKATRRAVGTVASMMMMMMTMTVNPVFCLQTILIREKQNFSLSLSLVMMTQEPLNCLQVHRLELGLNSLGPQPILSTVAFPFLFRPKHHLKFKLCLYACSYCCRFSFFPGIRKLFPCLNTHVDAGLDRMTCTIFPSTRLS